jgi:GNAT superfamily N-acetyltransferase
MADLIFKQKGHRYSAELQGEVIAHATVNDGLNFVQSLYVKREHRLKGVATELVRYIAKTRGKRLNEAPRSIKSPAIAGITKRMVGELGPEVVLDDILT